MTFYVADPKRGGEVRSGLRPAASEDISKEMLRRGADVMFRHQITGMALWREKVVRDVLVAALADEAQG